MFLWIVLVHDTESIQLSQYIAKLHVIRNVLKLKSSLIGSRFESVIIHILLVACSVLMQYKGSMIKQ